MSTNTEENSFILIEYSLTYIYTKSFRRNKTNSLDAFNALESNCIDQRIQVQVQSTVQRCLRFRWSERKLAVSSATSFDWLCEFRDFVWLIDMRPAHESNVWTGPLQFGCARAGGVQSGGGGVGRREHSALLPRLLSWPAASGSHQIVRPVASRLVATSELFPLALWAQNTYLIILVNRIL